MSEEHFWKIFPAEFHDYLLKKKRFWKSGHDSEGKLFPDKGTPSLSRRMPMEFHLLNSMQVYGALNNVQKKYFSKSFI